MEALFVVTTKDLPLSGFARVENKYSNQMDDYLKGSILEDNDLAIVEYLKNYKHKMLKESTRVYLNSCDEFPILKRFVGDYGIYVAPCLSEDESGYGDEYSHGFIGKLMDIAENDIKDKLNTVPKQIYVIVHEADLTFAADEPKVFSQDRCLTKKLKDLPDGHIYIFWHELRFRMYKDFILKLSDPDDSTVIQACKDALDIIEG